MAAPWLVSCTTVNIYSAKGVETHEYFGWTTISARPGDKPVFVRTEGLGVIGASQAMSVGWLREDLAIFPDAGTCAVMVVPRDFRDFPQSSDVFARYPKLFDPCTKLQTQDKGG